MWKRLLLVVLLLGAVAGCNNSSAPAETPEPSGTCTQAPNEPSDPALDQVPGTGELEIDRLKVISDVAEHINEIAPDQPEGGLKWSAERIAVLAPRYVLVWYTEGHTANLTLFRVNDVDGQYQYEVVLDGTPDVETPVDWEWRVVTPDYVDPD